MSRKMLDAPCDSVCMQTVEIFSHHPRDLFRVRPESPITDHDILRISVDVSHRSKIHVETVLLQV